MVFSQSLLVILNFQHTFQISIITSGSDISVEIRNVENFLGGRNCLRVIINSVGGRVILTVRFIDVGRRDGRDKDFYITGAKDP